MLDTSAIPGAKDLPLMEIEPPFSKPTASGHCPTAMSYNDNVVIQMGLSCFA